MQEILNNTDNLMLKAVEALKRDLATVNTGRATPSLLDTIRVECYGNFMPLNQVSNVSVLDSSTLLIQVWDRSMISHVEKGIQNANLGFNPMVDGTSIRINIPKLSEERRKELCKIVKRYGEDKKIAVRNVRKDSLEKIKKIKKDFSEDFVKDSEDKIQELTDKHIKNIDLLVASKENDLLVI